MQQPVLSPPRFRTKSSHILKHSPQNFTAVCRTDCLAYQDQFLVNNHLDPKENYEHVLDFVLYPSCLFGLSEFGLLHSNTQGFVGGNKIFTSEIYSLNNHAHLHACNVLNFMRR
jgi:hypothetical protein